MRYLPPEILRDVFEPVPEGDGPECISVWWLVAVLIWAMPLAARAIAEARP